VSTFLDYQMSSDKAALRVAVAKDALAQLEDRKYRETQGVYIENASNDEYFIYDDETCQQFLDRMLNSHCYVCAKGALLLSSLRVGDIEPGPGIFFEELSANITEIFDRDQWNLIEDYFEETNSWNLRRILNNIIDNNGTFTP
jgi:hypothetical protein